MIVAPFFCHSGPFTITVPHHPYSFWVVHHLLVLILGGDAHWHDSGGCWMLESWTDVVGVESGINKLEGREANLKTSEESCAWSGMLAFNVLSEGVWRRWRHWKYWQPQWCGDMIWDGNNPELGSKNWALQKNVEDAIIGSLFSTSVRTNSVIKEL